MANYVIGADGINRPFPPIFEERIEIKTTEPTETGDGNFVYGINSGSKAIINLNTRPTEDSNVIFNKLYGYLKGRGWVSERIYLERFGGEIQGYIRFNTIDTNFQGKIKNKRSTSISIYQKY